ncbi:MAG: M67 family metallopeptidase [Chitinophagaceae bacterium]
MIAIEQQVKQIMAEDALKTFPDECCGFLFGLEKNNERLITGIQIVNNAKEGDKKRRFEISAKDYLKAEQHAEKNNLQLLGVYHSHPNHPAIPSEHDRVAAQPWFSYIIISVYNKRVDAIRSWRLNDEAQFNEEKIADYQLT